jgi:hypothetical protein
MSQRANYSAVVLLRVGRELASICDRQVANATRVPQQAPYQMHVESKQASIDGLILDGGIPVQFECHHEGTKQEDHSLT